MLGFIPMYARAEEQNMLYSFDVYITGQMLDNTCHLQ